MGIKRNVAAVIGGFLIFCHSAMAGQIYNMTLLRAGFGICSNLGAKFWAGGFVFSIDQNGLNTSHANVATAMESYYFCIVRQFKRSN